MPTVSAASRAAPPQPAPPKSPVQPAAAGATAGTPIAPRLPSPDASPEPPQAAPPAPPRPRDAPVLPGSRGRRASSAPRDSLPGPTLISPPDGKPNQETSVDLSWYPVEGAYTYRAEYYTAASGWSYSPYIYDPTTDYWTPDLTPGARYYWAVYACDGNADCGNLSQEWQFDVQPLAPQLSAPSPNGSVSGDPVTFEWYEVAGDTDYYLSYVDQTTHEQSPTPDLGNTFYDNVSGLNVGDTYAWLIDGCNDGNNCSESPIWYFTVTAPPPVAPDLPSPSNGSTVLDGTVQLGWYAAGSDTDYQYYYAPAGAQYYSGPFDVGDQFSVSIGPLTPGTECYWEVAGCTTSCIIGNPWNFTMQPLPPSTPQLEAPADGGTTTSTDVTFYWYQAGNDTDYQFSWRDNSASGSFQGPFDFGSALSIGYTGFKPGDTYAWKVIGCTAPSACLQSDTWTFTAPLFPVAPQQTAPTSGAGGLQNPVTVSWALTSPDTSYIVGWADDTTAGGYTYTAPVGAGTNSYTLPTLTFGDQHDWKAYGCTPTEGCLPSLVWTFTMAVPPPVAPQPLQPTNGANGVQNPVTLTWSPAGSDNDYRVSYQDLTANSAPVGNDVGSKTSYALPTLPAGHLFWWYAYGCTAANSCATTANPNTFTMYAPAPGTPQLSAPASSTTNADTTPTLSWTSSSNAVPGATYYQVGLWDGQSGSPMGSYLVTNEPTTQVQVPASQGLVLGRSYSWSVYACTGQLCSAWSTFSLFTTVPAPSAAAEQSPTDDATGVGTSPTLTWAPPASSDYSGETHYYVNVYDTVTQAYVLENGNAGTSLSQAVSGLAGADLYQWQVVACNGADATQDCASDTWYTFDTGNAVSNGPAYPGFTTTWYIQSTSLSAASTLGCTAVGASTVSALDGPRVLILDFGAQTDGAPPNNPGATVHGAELAGSTIGTASRFIADSYLDTVQGIGGIAEVTKSFVSGYDGCRPNGQTGKTTFVLGTNNSVIPACNPDPAIGCGYGKTYGSDWADVVGITASEVANQFGTSIYAVMGGSDIEQDPPNCGDQQGTQAWVANYYVQSGGFMLYNFGSCDDCHYASGTGCTFDSCTVDGTYPWPDSVDQSWNVQDVASLAGASGETLMVPEIYGPNQAQQWGYLLLYANSSSGASPLAPSLYVYLKGLLTQCIAAGGTGTDTPRAAWSDMGAVLVTPDWSYYLGAEDPVISTDIGYQGYPVPGACN